MKRLLAMMLILMLLGGMCLAEEGSLRHKIFGDVSEFTVGEELDHAQEENAQTASVHTDVYLYVDPDTASYVTFIVRDDDGKPLPGASIYISYKGEEELFGVTDENGEVSMYLFRDVQYGYRVVKSGYEGIRGGFTADEELKRVRAVLAKYRKVTLQAQKNGEPWGNAVMYLDGERIFADANGAAVLRRVNGEYLLELQLENGRRISKRIVVSGDGTFTINYVEDDLLTAGGAYTDRFLVYHDLELPKDYELTYYPFTADDLDRLPDETDEEFDARVQRYLAAYPSTIFVEAQPEEDGYTQRIMVPSGWLQRAWENDGYERVAFVNGAEGLVFDLEDLHSPEMMRAFAVLYAMTDGSQKEIIADKDVFRESGLPALMGKDVITLNHALLNGVKDFVFGSKAKGEGNVLPDELFINTWFEYRLTPIRMDVLEQMIWEGMQEDGAEEEIVLANADYFRRALREWQAEGGVRKNTLEKLAEILADSCLTSDEATEIRAMLESGELNREKFLALLDNIVEGSMYRVSCVMHYGDVEIDITELLPSLCAFWNIDAFAEAEEIAAHPESYRGIFIREGDDPLSLIYDPQRLTLPDDEDEFREIIQEKLNRLLNLHVYPDPNDPQDWIADAEDDTVRANQLRLLKTEIPFAGVNALMHVRDRG